MSIIALIAELVPIIRLVVSSYGLIINSVIAFCALVALIIAIISLRETAKARRDMFLPIITTLGISHSGATGTIRIRNVGHGVAFNIKAYLTGADPIEITSECPPSYELNPQREFTLPKVPKRQLYSNPQLVIFYFDVFGRQIRTVYNVTLKPKADDYLAPTINYWSRRILLPWSF